MSVLGALVKGFVAELISLASVVCGLFLAFYFYEEVARILEGFGLTSTTAFLFGFMFVFAATLVVGTIIIRIARRTLTFLYFRWFDRLLGGVFGALRGWVTVSVVFLAMTAFPSTGDLVADSKTGEFFLTSARLMIVLAPAELREKFSQEYSRIYKLWLERTRQSHYARGSEE